MAARALHTLLFAWVVGAVGCLQNAVDGGDADLLGPPFMKSAHALLDGRTVLVPPRAETLEECASPRRAPTCAERDAVGGAFLQATAHLATFAC